MPALQIRPLDGIGDISFGMSVTEVRRLLGDPEKSVIDIREDRANITSNRLIYSRKWVYPSLGLVLSFSAPYELSVDMQLRGITIQDSDAMIDGVRLLGLSEREFLNAIAGTQVGAVELMSDLHPLEWTDSECVIREYVCEKARMTFWIENDIVTSICMWDEWRTTPYIKFKTTVMSGIPDVEEEH